jgi:hypothetical protein
MSTDETDSRHPQSATEALDVFADTFLNAVKAKEEQFYRLLGELATAHGLDRENLMQTGKTTIGGADFTLTWDGLIDIEGVLIMMDLDKVGTAQVDGNEGACRDMLIANAMLSPRRGMFCINPDNNVPAMIQSVPMDTLNKGELSALLLNWAQAKDVVQLRATAERYTQLATNPTEAKVFP